MDPKNLLPIAATLGVAVTISVILILRQGEINRDQAAAKDLQERIQFAKSHGVWDMDLTSLVPAVNPDDNAEQLYHQAAGLLATNKAPRHIPQFDDPQDRNLFADYLRHIQPSMDLAAKASLRPSIVLQSDTSEEPEIDFPGYSELKTMAKCFLYRAELEIHLGQKEAALNDLSIIARISRHCGQSPNLTAVMMQIAIDGYLFEGLEILLTKAPDSAKEATPILKELGNDPSLVPGLRKEFLTVRHLLSKSSQDSIPDRSGVPETKGMDRLFHNLKKTWARNRYLAGVIDYYSYFLTKVRPNTPPSQVIQSAQSTDSYANNRKDFDYEFVHVVSGDLATPARITALDIAKRRIFAQSIAILASGKIPDKLPLKGDNAIDPTTDQPLHYKRTSNGFQIYAVGKSGVDHGGVRAGERRDGKYISSDEADILFSYPYRKPVTR